MRQILLASALAALAACAPPTAQQQALNETPPTSAPAQVDAPAGTYRLDPSHASVTFRVNHLGFSNYTGNFARFDATLELDPTNPAAARLTATIDPNSVEVPAPPAGFLDELRGPQFLNTRAHREMRFESTSVEMTAPNAARVTGNFTMNGVTRPLTLNTTFNGAYRGHPMDPNARIGFSAAGSLNRSEFNMGYGVPAPGSTMGVGDRVDIAIEAEFTGPPLAPAAAPAQ